MSSIFDILGTILFISIPFAYFYYTFRWYLRGKGLPTEGLAKNLTVAFVISGVVYGGVLWIGLWAMIAIGENISSIPRILASIIGMSITTGAFGIPFVVNVRKRTPLPLLFTIGVTLLPFILLYALYTASHFYSRWEYNARKNVPPKPVQYHTDLSDMTYGGIQIISPNGGESFVIGTNIQIKWKAFNILGSASGAKLDLQLFEITGDKPEISEDNKCINCLGDGLPSGMSAISLKTGNGSASVEVGKLYSGGYVDAGNKYIIKATVSKVGDPDECDATTISCTTILDVDWSDVTFSLTKEGSQSDVSTVENQSTSTISATVDDMSGQPASAHPVVTGTAVGVESIFVTLADMREGIWHSDPVPVVNGRWSVKISPDYTPPSGMYFIIVSGPSNPNNLGPVLVTAKISIAR